MTTLLSHEALLKHLKGANSASTSSIVNPLAPVSSVLVLSARSAACSPECTLAATAQRFNPQKNACLVRRSAALLFAHSIFYWQTFLSLSPPSIKLVRGGGNAEASIGTALRTLGSKQQMALADILLVDCPARNLNEIQSCSPKHRALLPTAGGKLWGLTSSLLGGLRPHQLCRGSEDARPDSMESKSLLFALLGVHLQQHGCHTKVAMGAEHVGDSQYPAFEVPD